VGVGVGRRVITGPCFRSARMAKPWSPMAEDAIAADRRSDYPMDEQRRASAIALGEWPEPERR
jgi:hypothetical protein